MNNRQEHFADKLRNYKVRPPEAAWEGISAQLNPGQKRRNVIFVLAAAASLALAVTLGISLVELEQSNQQQTAGMTEKVQEIMNDVLKDEQPAIAQKTPQQAGSQPGIEKVAVTNNLADAGRDDVTPVVDESAPLVEERLPADGEDVSTGDGTAFTDNSVVVSGIDPEAAGPDAEEADIPAEQKISSLEELEAISGESTETDVEESQVNRWQLGASISPQYTYRDAASPDLTQNRVVDNSESGMIAYSGGVHVRYAAGGRLSVESGVYYNKMGVNIGSYDSFWGRLNAENDFIAADNRNVVTLANSIGNIQPEGDELYINKYSFSSERAVDYSEIQPVMMTFNGEEISTITQTFSYLEVPLNLRYKIIDRKVGLQLIGGISTNVLVSNSVIGNTVTESVKIGYVQDVRTMNYSGNAGIGLVYDILDRLVLNVEPRFRYYLNSVNNPLLPSTRPYSFGLFTGLNYSF